MPTNTLPVSFRRGPARAVYACAWVLSLASACDVIPVPAAPFSRLVVFGDSLSDTGNIRLESLVFPADPYSLGRFSNGDVWIQHVARRFGLAAWPSYVGGTNFAHGGAETGTGFYEIAGFPIGANILTQIDLYAGCPVGTELFVVWGGANDVFSLVYGPASATAAPAADNIAAAVSRLYERGARNFLVPNLPDIGRTPTYSRGSRAARATQLTQQFNAALAAHLDNLAALSGITLYRLDVSALFDGLLAVPPEGVTDTTHPAWEGSFLGYLGGGMLAQDPDAYLFWDSVHPTRIAHERLAAAAIALLEASPPAQRTPVLTGLICGAPLPPPAAYWLAYAANLPAALATE